MTTHSNILVWRIPWTWEEPKGLHNPWGHKQSDMTKHTHTHISQIQIQLFLSSAQDPS